MGALWASWFMMCETDPVRLVLPAWLRFSGLTVFIIGIILFILTLVKMRTLDNYSGELIQDGLFSITRHPMYAGFIFWIIGYPVFQQAQTSLLTSIIWILNVLFWRKIEEKELERSYSNYAEYKQKTFF
jgi:protein-S-isoprenylcysteine O-methyltransferase Ste14